MVTRRKLRASLPDESILLTRAIYETNREVRSMIVRVAEEIIPAFHPQRRLAFKFANCSLMMRYFFTLLREDEF